MLRRGVKNARYLCLYQPDESVMAKHNTKEGHHIKDTRVHARIICHMYQIVKEANEILLHLKNFDRQAV
jgi:hypothetical protein